MNAAGGERRYTDRVLPDVFNRETMTLADYRLRYSLYKSDEDLKAAHAAHPFVVAWDDHETENNYADDIPENAIPPAEFLLRRPPPTARTGRTSPCAPPSCRRDRTPSSTAACTGAHSPSSDILDTRQYRSDQAYDDRPHAPGPGVGRPARTITGAAQGAVAAGRLAELHGAVDVMPQQVCFSQRKFDVTATPRSRWTPGTVTAPRATGSSPGRRPPASTTG